MVLVTGPKCIPRKGLLASSVGRFCEGNHEQHHFQTVVILEQDHSCQWISHFGFTLTSRDLLLLGTIWRLKWAASKKEIAHLIVLDHDGLQSYFAQQVQPSCSRK